MSLLDTPEWLLGDAAQKQWAQIIVAHGGIAVPAYGLKEISSATKAPMLLGDRRVYVSPDILFLHPKKKNWHEVKAKSSPTWRRNPPGPRWEHGIDFQLIEEYSEVENQSGLPVYIIVQENSKPKDPGRESILIPCSVWRYISLSRAKEVGSIREDWPGGKAQPWRRGRGGRGGWLWNRLEMGIAKGV